ncbi:MAG: nucleoside triphosphate pyrophosphohydrolase family protein [Poseidonibacter sp.]
MSELTPSEIYAKSCRRTLSEEDDDVLGHMVIGISTEAGELLDAYKKHKFYKRDLDTKNIKEEIGDCLWYLAILADELDYTLEDAMTDNLLKLQKRYPEKFKDVLVRNQDEELNHIDNSEDIVTKAVYRTSQDLEYALTPSLLMQELK